MSAGSCLMESSSTVGKLNGANGFEATKSGLNRDSAVEEEMVPLGEVKRLMTERDDVWRQHERAQLHFVQEEHKSMLAKLHKEIERLQTKLAEAQREAIDTASNFDTQRTVNSDKTLDDLRGELVTVKTQLDSCRNDCDAKQAKLTEIEQRLSDMQITYENRLADLQTELDKARNSKTGPEKPHPATADKAKASVAPRGTQPLSKPSTARKGATSEVSTTVKAQKTDATYNVEAAVRATTEKAAKPGKMLTRSAAGTSSRNPPANAAQKSSHLVAKDKPLGGSASVPTKPTAPKTPKPSK